MLDRLGLSGEAIPDRRDPDAWPALRERLRKEFRRRTRDEWAVIMADADACVTPVLSMDEVARHPHHLARNAFVDFEGLVQPAPAPRFSRTPSALRRGPPEKGEGAGEALRAWGVEAPGP
jgi:alpha-methylacyl-CoA racemase